MNTYKESSFNNWSEDSVRMILTTSPLARNMYYYVQEVGYFKALHKYYTERENLNSFLVVYTLSGTGLLKYRGREYSLQPGQAFFINCMEYQFYKSTTDAPWEFLWVHFNGCASLAYFNQYMKNGDSVIDIQDALSIKQILSDIINVNQNRNFKTEMITSKLITDLLTQLLISAYTSNTADSMIPKYINDTVRYIEKHYKQKITLDHLSKQFSIDKFHLQKEFKHYMGLTPNTYMINCRLNHAKELLKYSDLSVKEISYEIGIENISHFINLFKKSEHKTPLTYKNEWRD